MRIRISREQALEIARRHYPTGRPPITKTTPKGNFKTLAWWLSSPREKENYNLSWKRIGLDIYLEIMRVSGLDYRGFPCVFELVGGRLWPDKEIVKVCIQKGIVRDEEIDGELFFTLTEKFNEEYSK